MKKSRGILSLILVAALSVLLGVTTIRGLDSEGMGAAKNINLGLDLEGGVSITYQVKGDKPSQEDMDDTVYKMQRRVEQYSTEAQAYQEGDNRISIEIPGVEDANAILEELGQPGSLYFIKHKDADGNENYTLGAEGYVLNKTIDELKANGSIVLTGSEVKSATAGAWDDQKTGKKMYGVDLTLNAEGTDAFAAATTEAYNNGNDTIAIYYDGELISVPSVNAIIENGQAQITGSASYEEADNIASTIRIGGLNLELEELSSEVVGAQLGQDALKGSLIAGAITWARLRVPYLFSAASMPDTVPGTPTAKWPLALRPSMTLPSLSRYILAVAASGADAVICQVPGRDNTEGKIVLSEELDRVRMAIRELPERECMAIQLKFDLDRTDAEIAQLMGISVDSVRRYIHRGRERIRQKVYQEEKDDE